jgi:hypothetical protein
MFASSSSPSQDFGRGEYLRETTTDWVCDYLRHLSGHFCRNAVGAIEELLKARKQTLRKNTKERGKILPEALNYGKYVKLYEMEGVFIALSSFILGP